jgi:hypothetical protein
MVRSRPSDHAKKEYVLRLLEEQTNSFAYTRKTLEMLHNRAQALMSQLQMPNPAIEKILDLLRDTQESIKYSFDG